MIDCIDRYTQSKDRRANIKFRSFNQRNTSGVPTLYPEQMMARLIYDVSVIVDKNMPTIPMANIQFGEVSRRVETQSTRAGAHALLHPSRAMLDSRLFAQ